MQNTSFFRSTDGGATYEVINNGTHGDFHDFWIDPDDPAHVVVANDGGGAVSFTTGSEWTDQEFSTAQFCHGVTTAHIPWHICGSQQDNSTLCLPSDWNAARFASALASGEDDSGAAYARALPNRSRIALSSSSIAPTSSCPTRSRRATSAFFITSSAARATSA